MADRLRPSFLDTTIIIAILRPDPVITTRISTISAAVSHIIIGELLYGAEISGQTEQEVAKIQSLLAETRLLRCDWTTAGHYAKIKANLKQRGELIPENDMWIAATAMHHNVVLITRDRRHFERVEGLLVEFW
ncbi:MAG: PIN domain-containing protein [Herpetosiphonaceae bacterium]|nr:PIN domain-containing protein [Herpetosiphonaceae bacterium]